MKVQTAIKMNAFLGVTCFLNMQPTRAQHYLSRDDETAHAMRKTTASVSDKCIRPMMSNLKRISAAIYAKWVFRFEKLNN